MRWDFVFEHWTARLLADPALQSVMGADSGWIHPAQSSRPVGVPSIEYLIIGDVETELFNPISVQVDFWAVGIKKAAQIERCIRRLTHSDVGQDLGGERMWLRYQDGRMVDYVADTKVVHKILTFEFEPVREKYAAL